MQGVSRREVFVAVGREHDQRLTSEAGDQVGQRVPRGEIGPLHVVDDQDGRDRCGDPRDQALGRADQAHRSRIGRTSQGGQQQRRIGNGVQHPVANGRVGLGQPVLEGHHPRQERRLDGTEPQAAAPEHREAQLPCLVAHSRDQTGLPHAGLTVHEHRTRVMVCRPADRIPQQLELTLPPGDAEPGRESDSGHRRQCPPPQARLSLAPLRGQVAIPQGLPG